MKKGYFKRTDSSKVIVKLANGWYVKEWEIDTTGLHVQETKDPMQALDFTGNEHHFQIFLKKLGKKACHLMFLRVTVQEHRYQDVFPNYAGFTRLPK